MNLPPPLPRSLSRPVPNLTPPAPSPDLSQTMLKDASREDPRMKATSEMRRDRSARGQGAISPPSGSDPGEDGSGSDPGEDGSDGLPSGMLLGEVGPLDPGSGILEDPSDPPPPPEGDRQPLDTDRRRGLSWHEPRRCPPMTTAFGGRTDSAGGGGGGGSDTTPTPGGRGVAAREERDAALNTSLLETAVAWPHGSRMMSFGWGAQGSLAP